MRNRRVWNAEDAEIKKSVRAGGDGEVLSGENVLYGFNLMTV